MPPRGGASRSIGRTSDQFAAEAPTYYPTTKELEDVGAYIESIRPEVEKFGLCKLVLPEGTRPSFAIDKKKLTFKSRIQVVNQLQERGLLKEDFEESYRAWLQTTGRTVTGKLTVSGRDINSFHLFKTVKRMGGFEKVSKDGLWKDVCRILPSHKKSSHIASILKGLYQKHFLEYEQSLQGSESAKLEPSKEQMELEKAIQRAIAANDEIQLLYLSLCTLFMFGQDKQGQPSKFPAMDAHLNMLQEKARKVAQKSDLASSINTMVCETCKHGSHEDKIILCDSCDKGHHIFCLSPPLTAIPEGDWLCPGCGASTGGERTAFRDGKDYPFEDFEAAATAFKSTFFGSKNKAEKASMKDMETAFWRIVEDAGPEEGGQKQADVEVHYGADLDTSVTGSGFPTAGHLGVCPDTKDTRKMTECPWNLNNLPRLDCSLLKYMGEDVMGVTKPWMYLGMMFSSFCWHIEDHMMYSVNYHHFGDVKRWYGVPASASSEFEGAFKRALPEVFRKQPDTLFHLDTMLSPRIIQSYNVPVYSVSQGPGEIVVTYPGAYHAGFNTGLNCAEAVNFAPADWLRFAEQGLQKYKTFQRHPVFCHSRLLLQAAADNPSLEMAKCLAPELEKLVDAEREWRNRVRNTGCFKATKVEQPVGMTQHSTDDEQCAVDKSYLHLSALSCKCCPRRFVSLKNARELCGCHPSHWRLHYRHSLGRLEEILDNLYDIISLPQDKRREHRIVFTELPAEPVAPVMKDDKADAIKEEEVSREASGEATPIQTDDISMEEVVPKLAPAAPAAPLRKRGRKNAPLKAEKSTLSSPEPEAPPPAPVAPRVTRAARQAEEKVQSEMEVAEVLLGLADRTDFPKSKGSPSPASDTGPSDGTSAPKRSHRVSARNLVKADLHFLVEGPTPLTATPAIPERVYASLTGDFDLPAAFERMAGWRREWLRKAQEIFQTGGARPATVEALVQQSQQFLWADSPLHSQIQPLLDDLRGAQAWAQKVNGLMKTKATLEEVESSLETAPINVPNLSKLVNGVRDAKAWRTRFNAAQSEDGTLPLKALESLVQDAGRLPILIPELKDLKERMVGGRALQAQVVQVTSVEDEPPEVPPPQEANPDRPRSKRRKVSNDAAKEAPAVPAPEPVAQPVEISVQYLKSLKDKAVELKVTSSAISRLFEDLSGAESLQARIAEAFTTKPPLDSLAVLYEEALGLSLELPELKRVKKIMMDATNWLYKLPSVRNQKSTLKKLRDFSNQGARLGVDLPEVAEIRKTVKEREYVEATKKMLNGKPKLEAIESNIAWAAASDLQDLEIAKTVQSLLEKAKLWTGKAEAFFADPIKRPLSDLQDLADEGNSLKLKLDLLAEVNLQYNKVQRWMHSAEAIILPSDDSSCNASLEQIDQMLDMYNEPEFRVELTEAGSLLERKEEALKWIEQARLTLQKERSEQFRDEFESVLAEGLKLRLDLDELEGVRNMINALDWEKKVSGFDLKGPWSSAPQAAPNMDELLRAAEHSDPRPPAELGNPHQLAEPSTSHSPRPPKRGFFEMNLAPHEPQLQPPSKRQALPGGASVPNPTTSVPTLTVEQARQLIQDGRDLKVDENLMNKLEYNISLAEEWQQRLNLMAAESPQNNSYMSQRHGATDRATLLPMVREARGMVPQPDSLAALEAGLEKSEQWSARVHNLFKGKLVRGAICGEIPYLELPPGKKPQFSEVSAIAKDGQGLLVRAEAQGPLEAVIQAAEAWKEQCCLRFSRPKKPIRRLDKGISIMRERLRTARERLESYKQLEKGRAPVVAGSFDYGFDDVISPESSRSSSKKSSVYCCCQTVLPGDSDMVACDSCKEWYHCQCLATTINKVKQKKTFTCPICADDLLSSNDLAKCSEAVRETSRLEVEEIQQMLDSAERLPCCIEDAQFLEKMVVDFMHWEKDVTMLLHQHNLDLIALDNAAPLKTGLGRDGSPLHNSNGNEERNSQMNGSGRLRKPLSLATLRQLLRSSISMEIAHPDLESKILDALTIATWRRDVQRVFAKNARQPLSVMTKLMGNGRYMDANSQHWALPLRERCNGYLQWMERAGELPARIQELAESDCSASIFTECRRLRAEAERMLTQAKEFDKAYRPKGFERVRDRMKAGCEVFCLCNKTWDPEEPMLDCDKCHEWYHYDCTGLRKPGDDEVDADVAPSIFVCPLCARQEPYGYNHVLPPYFNWVLE